MMEPLTYTVEQAAQLIGISRAAAYEAIKKNEIPHRKIGRRIVVPRNQLQEWLTR